MINQLSLTFRVHANSWNANNTQSTLPSIPLIGMDDDIAPISTAPPPVSEQSSYQQPQQQQPYQPPNQYQPPPPPHHHPIQSAGINNFQSSNVIGNSSNAAGGSSNNNHNYHHNNHHQSQQLPLLQSNAHGNEVGVLSSSDSSSDSDSSGSGSDSDDNDKSNIKTHSNHSMSNPIQDSLPAHLLDEDLRLSESNSSDSDWLNFFLIYFLFLF